MKKQKQKKLTMKDLAQEVCLLEGKKVEVSYPNVREILSIISDLMVRDAEVVSVLLANGLKRIKN